MIMPIAPRRLEPLRNKKKPADNLGSIHRKLDIGFLPLLDPPVVFNTIITPTTAAKTPAAKRLAASPPVILPSLSEVQLKLRATQTTRRRTTETAPLKWDWNVEQLDRKREAKADSITFKHAPGTFDVDRKILRDIVSEKTGKAVGRINFLSAGTFHKAYLVTFSDQTELVARVARRFMPRLKTTSEVATMRFLSTQTKVPVPDVYHHDSNPFNRLGGEYILMSKASGVPLGSVYHTMSHRELAGLMQGLAEIIIHLFSRRFSYIGSLETVSKIGPIVSWPFFGTNRGDLKHPTEIDRGPWASSSDYFHACAQREINGVIRENQGTAPPHKLYLDPDDCMAAPSSMSDDGEDDSDEDEDDEWASNGEQDCRRAQMRSFLIPVMAEREERVRKEMTQWISLMTELTTELAAGETAAAAERFGIDCHDLSLENIFVDASNHCKISCIIDWESTTTRPLWQCAHLPTFLQRPGHADTKDVAALFRQAVLGLTTQSGQNDHPTPISSAAREWLYYERAGASLRAAHKFVEWDGWEEGLFQVYCQRRC